MQDMDGEREVEKVKVLSLGENVFNHLSLHSRYSIKSATDFNL